MSYCVNCGVELDDSAKKCVLCSTPVYNPRLTDAVNREKPFSDEVNIPHNIKRRFVAYVITMIMLIPNIVLFFVNVCFYRDQYWSVYILSTSLLVWVLFVFPFYTKKLRPYLMWAFDTVAAAAYSYVFIVMQSESSSVFKSVASVIVLCSFACLFMIIWLRRKKRHWTAILVQLFADACIIAFAGGSLIYCFTDKSNFFYAGLICACCFFPISVFFLYCNRSKHMRAWLNKAFNI